MNLTTRDVVFMLIGAVGALLWEAWSDYRARVKDTK